MNWFEKNIADPVIEFVNSFGKVWGIDILDRIAGKKRGDWTEATLIRVINEALANADVNDQILANKLNSQLEALIGIIPSPTIRNVLQKWKNKIRSKINTVTKSQAGREKDRVQLNTLASDINNQSALEFGRDDGGKKELFREKISEYMKDDPDTASRVKQIEGWENFKPEDHIKNKKEKEQVEERL